MAIAFSLRRFKILLSSIFISASGISYTDLYVGFSNPVSQGFALDAGQPIPDFEFFSDQNDEYLYYGNGVDTNQEFDGVTWRNWSIVRPDPVALNALVPAGNIVAIRPMRDGVITNFEVTEAMLRHFIRKVRHRRFQIRPRIVIAIPSGITEVERRAVKESAERAGARDVFLIEELLLLYNRFLL